MHVYHQFESHFNGHHFLLRNSINSHFPLKSSRVDDLFTDDFQKAALPRTPSWIEFSNSPLVSRKILLDSGAIDEPREGMGTMPSLVELAETESSSSSRNWASNFLTRFPLFPPRHDSYIHLCLTSLFFRNWKESKIEFHRSGPIKNSSLLEIRLWI